MSITEAFQEELHRKVTEASNSAIETMERILSDTDRFIVHNLEMNLKHLAGELEAAGKELAGLKNAGAGSTEHPRIFDSSVMPAWKKFENEVTALGFKFQNLRDAVHKAVNG